MDALNPQPRVWPAVAALLRSHFPELLEPVRRMLFDRLCRQAYLAELRTCVAESARNVAWRTVSVGVSEASGGQTKTSTNFGP